MGTSCLVTTHVRNPKGEMVESKLFNDLSNYLPSRELAKEYYKVGTDEDFLNNVRHRAEFDENGEITFNSLRKLAHINIEEERIIDKLNKEIGAGVTEYQRAKDKIKDFNENHQFKKDYMATVTLNDKGEFNLHIVKRTPSNIAELNKTTENKEIVDALVDRLNKHGVNVTFLTEATGGRYSTLNAERTANGLYNLIKVAHGEEIAMNLAEESGHFAIAALGKSPLVDRLIKLLDDTTIREILGEDYNNKDLGDNPGREVAGMLVGQALIDKLTPKSNWGRLAMRISDMAKSIFSRFSKGDVGADINKAKKIARDIASGFLSDNFEGTVDNALNYKETLNRSVLPYNIRTYKRVVDALGKMAKEMEGVASDSLSTNLQAYMARALKGRDDVIVNPTLNSEFIAFEGLCQILTDMMDMLGPDKEIDRLIQSVDFDNPTEFYVRMAEHGNSLRKARVFTKNAVLIASLLRDAVDSLDNKLVLPSGQTLSNAFFTDSVSRLQNIDFRSTLNEFERLLKIVDSQVSSKENLYFCRFCEDIYGGTYVNTAAQVVWNNHRLTVQQADKIPISDLLAEMESDIDVFHRYIGTMSNNPDIIGQIVDKAVKAANKVADDKTIQYWERLKELETRLKNEYGITDTSFMFEKDSEGNWTGNFITAENPDIRDKSKKSVAVNYGEWEKARKEFRKNFEEDFKKRHPDWESWTGFTRGYRFNEEYHDAYKKWNEDNSVYVPITDGMGNKIGGDWHPNAKYKSTQYDEILAKYPGINSWLGEFNEIKRELDSMLDPRATHSWRAPQFKGTFSNRLANKKNIMSTKDAIKHSIRESIAETFCESSEDTDYGDNTTLNDPNETLLGTPMDFAKDKPNRIPMFGINKLDDMTQLSTDVFHSMLAYASMATSYMALSSVVDAVEVGRNAINNRQIIGKAGKREKDLENHTRAYTRYTKYLDKQVYGISATRWGFTMFGRKILLNKVIQAMTKWGTFRFLGGNVLGGAVNTGTGTIEVLKEAASSDEFGLDDLLWAHKYYFSSLPNNLMQSASLQKDDKMSLWIRQFNVRGDNREKFRTRHRSKSWLRRVFESAVFLPYSSGDHYMQSMAYLSIAHKTRLTGTKGTRCNLWEAYDRIQDGVRHGKFKDKKTYSLQFKGKLYDSATGYNGITYNDLQTNEVFLKNSGDRVQYNILEGLLGEVEKALSSPLLSMSLTTEQQDYLNKNNLDISDLDSIRTSVQNDIFKIIWTSDDETKYMDMAREINIRMHGVYNNQDKTAFHQQWYTNAFLAMKGYALGMMERRFSNAHHSVALGTDVEGSINTMSKLWFSTLAKDVNITWYHALGATFLGPFIAKNQKLKQRLTDAGFSDFQISNMKRNWMDMFMLGLLYILRMLTAEPPEEEREEDYNPDNIEGLCHYFATRWIREQEAFNAPWGLMHESTSLLDAVPVGMAGIWDLAKLGYEATGATVADEADSDFFYQRDHKNGKYEEGDPKAVNHALGMIPYAKSWYNIENPYDALDSYEYGRKISGR